MAEFEITLNEANAYHNTFRKDSVDADEFKVTEGKCDTDGCVNRRGDLILIKDDTIIATYKSERWIDVKLVPGENDG